jgi:hypothetical protein
MAQVVVAPVAVEPDAFVSGPVPVYAAAIGPGFAEQLAAGRDEAAAAVAVAVGLAWPLSSGSHFAAGEAQAGESRFHCYRCCGSQQDPSGRRDCSNAPWASTSAAVLFFEQARPELVEAELERGEWQGSAEQLVPAERQGLRKVRPRRFHQLSRRSARAQVPDQAVRQSRVSSVFSPAQASPALADETV